MANNLNFLDLFAGAGGLSEGFVRAGFAPVAHVERDRAASFTLKTRAAYHWLREQNDLAPYVSYLEGDIDRDKLYSELPDSIDESVLNIELAQDSLDFVFGKIDRLLNGKRLDLIVGGPPCQAYSLVGRSRSKTKMIGDDRNYLYILYAAFLDRYKPAVFVFENVEGLLSAKDGNGKSYFDAMRKLFFSAGYDTKYALLNSEDYGVLQSRKRVILYGVPKGGVFPSFPEPVERCASWIVNHAFIDLPKIKAGAGDERKCRLDPVKSDWLLRSRVLSSPQVPVTFHVSRPNNDRDLEIYKVAVCMWSKWQKRLRYDELPAHLKTHKNRTSFTDRYKVVAGDLSSSHTVVAHIAKDGHYYIHPDIRQNRSITPREAARLQSFPDDYFFESVSGKLSRTSAFQQIGNAVPVLLSEEIANEIKRSWK